MKKRLPMFDLWVVKMASSSERPTSSILIFPLKQIPFSRMENRIKKCNWQVFNDLIERIASAKFVILLVICFIVLNRNIASLYAYSHWHIGLELRSLAGNIVSERYPFVGAIALLCTALSNRRVEQQFLPVAEAGCV
jgi:hypothetical protein